ncbi:hypothetical protein CH272_28175 [Rhodococcus sp. 05-340-1]|uniref:hypothetical protein n=1 Tax=unclassified Rhodococcus (in: high G+C Gram-positive bacteria) TaxID=192944 RepID=UPI000B9A92A4|nr:MULTISPECIES: hypothetical protein [unclassified Rhodococcus (in: high G+C Gram-positive bacteria)]OZC87816.1 hypothetical protein CH254_14820 [Rhodococcus sp. 06-412-2C]OZC96465.1 hypothetical protein CH279_14985 [Rhodococcus sp. 06-412-2B]OZD65259.1 hypothetical protein CH271_19610 [Rhodococcus sp. 05-340-2]OZD69293.1 hypothetical protein CH272_28175 [Rhodococcus sp. 05-340-1]
MLTTAGLAVVFAAAVATLALRTKGKTKLANWAFLLMIVGNIITIAGLWTQLDDPHNIVHWIIKIGGTAAVAIIAAAGVYAVCLTGPAALLGPQRNSAADRTSGEGQ